MQNRANVKMELVVYGGPADLSGTLWLSHKWPDTDADRNIFQTFFFDRFHAPREEDDDAELTLEINVLDELTGWLNLFKDFRLSLQLSYGFVSEGNKSSGVDMHYKTGNKKDMTCGNPNWQNLLIVNVDTAKIGIELQTRINTAIKQLQGIKI